MQSRAGSTEEPLEDVREAYRRLTDMQALVTDVLGGFVHRPLHRVPEGIDDALARLGTFCGADRTYVFEMRPGDLMTNTHEWCAPGIKPEIDTLQDLPRDVIHFWLKPLAEGRPVYVPHVKALPDERADERDILDRQDIQSLLVVPMLNAGELFGFVGFDSVRTRRSFTAGELSLLTSVADVICSALVRREAARQVTNAQARLAAITEHASDLVLVMDEAGRVSWASPSVRRLTGREMTGARWWAAVSAAHRGTMEEAARALLADGTAGGATDLPDCLVETPDGDRWLASRAVDLRADPAVGGLVVTARDVTERRQAEDELAHRATHDMLTGLPNRALLADRLVRAADRARRRGHLIGLLFLDIDHFKLVNDGHGHGIGDGLLRQVADRLLAAVGPTDTVARFGGDEFVVLIEEAEEVSVLETRAVEIADRIAGSFLIEGREFFVTASIGLLVHDGRAFDVEGVLQRADAAMYRAKEWGRNRIVAFDAKIQKEVERHARIVHRIKRAIEAGDIRPSFQPIVRLGVREVVAREALARWRDPELGDVSPEDFVKVAERTGQIRALGATVLAQAVETAVRAGGNWRLTVNVSPLELDGPGLHASVTGALERSGLPPERLCLEITESAIAERPAEALATLRALRALGVRLAIDDFGRGYSSFGILRSMPFDYLKIDRSFIAGLSGDGADERLVKAVLGLAEDFGLAVVAEGIETAEQERILMDLGCRLGQGYLFGPPAFLAA